LLPYQDCSLTCWLIILQDLPVHYKDHPVGDDPFPEEPAQKSFVSFADDSGTDDLELKSEASSVSGRGQISTDGIHLKFPLYNVKGRGDAAHQPVGQIPLTLKWGKTLRPKTFNRTSGRYCCKVFVFQGPHHRHPQFLVN
jgi:hypothetical protein